MHSWEGSSVLALLSIHTSQAFSSSESRSPQNMSANPDAVWRTLEPTQLFVDVPISRSARRSTDCTRLVLMSDTHGMHRSVRLPEGDVLIHAGDFTRAGEEDIVRDLANYFGELRDRFAQIVCIAGNHDLVFHASFYEQHWQRFQWRREDDEACRKSLREQCIYLEDETCVLEKGQIEVYGSPWTPVFCDWAFNLPRGAPLRSVWLKIPSSTDVLITHGPPLGRGDWSSRSNRVGCVDLLEEVQQRIQPRLHVFGHIHEGYGASYDGKTLFVNAANLDAKYQLCQPCLVVDVPHDRSLPARLVQPSCQMSAPQFQTWLTQHGYSDLAPCLQGIDQDDFPSNDPLWENFHPLCSIMSLSRDPNQQMRLRRALNALYMASFETAVDM